LDRELGKPRRGPKKKKKKRSKNQTARKKAGSSGAGRDVVAYRHDDSRVNNPEVGIVHAESDPDAGRRTWQYDPHLDPALNFDSARAGIEKLIDDALPDRESEEYAEDVIAQLADQLLESDTKDRNAIMAAIRQAVEADRTVNGRDRMKAALRELKRMQAPYLNWTGKAERTSFDIDTVSLHVHERIDSATILAHAGREGGGAVGERRQADIFSAPFENLPLRQALDFYRHEKNWSNRLITGDSLLVMNSLLTKESMAGQVQMIYIDPPYGINYGSNFQPFVDKRSVKDKSDKGLTQEPEMIKAFRDTWELGIHSYLAYLFDRLLVARTLLNESGSVFVQISDENIHIVRNLMDEVFGADSALLRSLRDSLCPHGQEKHGVRAVRLDRLRLRAQ
jgi:adenine-specific DNA-methyltransferase